MQMSQINKPYANQSGSKTSIPPAFKLHDLYIKEIHLFPQVYYQIKLFISVSIQADPKSLD